MSITNVYNSIIAAYTGDTSTQTRTALVQEFSERMGINPADVTNDPEYISSFSDYMQKVYAGVNLVGEQSPLEVQKRTITDIIVEMTVSMLETIQNTLAVTCATQNALGIQRGQAILSSQLQKAYSDLMAKIPTLTGSETQSWNIAASSTTSVNANSIINGTILTDIAAAMADPSSPSIVTYPLLSNATGTPIALTNTFSPPMWYDDKWNYNTGGDRTFTNTFNLVLDRTSGTVKLQMASSVNLDNPPSGVTSWTATILSQTVNGDTSYSPNWQTAIQSLLASCAVTKEYDVKSDQNGRGAGKVILGFGSSGGLDISVRNMWPSDDWLTPGHVNNAVTYSGDASGCYYPPITEPQGYSWYSTVNMPTVTNAALASTSSTPQAWFISQSTTSNVVPSTTTFGFNSISVSDIAKYMSSTATINPFNITLRDSTGRQIAVLNDTATTAGTNGNGGWNGEYRTTFDLQFVPGKGVCVVATTKLYGQFSDDLNWASVQDPYSDVYSSSSPYCVNNNVQVDTYWLDKSSPSSSQDWLTSIQNGLAAFVQPGGYSQQSQGVVFSQTVGTNNPSDVASFSDIKGHSILTMNYDTTSKSISLQFKAYTEEAVTLYDGQYYSQGSNFFHNPPAATDGAFYIPWPYPAPVLPTNATEQQQKDYQTAADQASSARSTTNSQLQQFITNLKSKRQILQDQALSIQTTIGIAKSGMNQMADLTSTILSTIFTISKNIYK